MTRRAFRETASDLPPLIEQTGGLRRRRGMPEIGDRRFPRLVAEELSPARREVCLGSTSKPLMSACRESMR